MKGLKSVRTLVEFRTINAAYDPAILELGVRRHFYEPERDE